MAEGERLLRASGFSPRQSLEVDDNTKDTTRLLHEDDDDYDDEQKFQEALKSHQIKLPTSRRSSWTGIWAILLGLVAVITGAGFYAFKSEAVYGQSPPWYPTPKGGSLDSWGSSYEKARLMVNKMTLLEKVNVTTGVGWASGFCLGDTAPALSAGFPGLCLQDGPLGLRHVDHVTVFPAGLTVGATFNKELMYRRGKAFGREARVKGVNVILGPSMGALGKIPQGGRNWEGFGSDPVLQGIAAAETIRGIQEEGVMATAKHFVGNEQERFRQAFEWGLPNALSANIDDRTMHEVYAWPFANSIRMGVASIMCSYQMINNSYACSNSKLLNGMLKDELGFQGYIQSDWLAQRAGVASALAGLDVTMPGDGLYWANGDSLWGDKLTASVLNGSVPEERLNDMAARVVAAWYQLGQEDKTKFPEEGPNFSSWTDKEVDRIYWSSGEDIKGVVNQFKDAQGKGSEFVGRLVKTVAAEGTVLVKNEDGILPLRREGWPEATAPPKARRFRVGVYGEDAGPGDGPNACPDRACNNGKNQGTLAIGWGSGTADFTYLVTPLEALQSAFYDKDVEVEAYLTNDPPIQRNASIADKDLCLIFVNANSGEGFAKVDGNRGDRNDLWPQRGGDALVQKVAGSCGGDGSAPSIVVVHAVGPVLLERWVDMPNIKAVVLAHLPGQESGHGLTDVLFGWKDASGRLPYTIGKSLEDYGPGAQLLAYPNGVIPQQNFEEGLFIDYRHFDRKGIEPRYEFGYGLSYTTFKYEDLKIEQLKPKSPLPETRPKGREPPKYDSKPLPDAKDVLFPNDLHRVKNRVYPYLQSAAAAEPTGTYPYPDGYDTPQPPSPAGGGEGGNPSLWEDHVKVTVNVKNTGERRGMEVVQAYVSFPQGATDVNGDEIVFPVRVLRAFDKVEILSGESKSVELTLSRRDLSYWSVVQQNWVMPTDEFTIGVGSSSRKIHLEGKW